MQSSSPQSHVPQSIARLDRHRSARRHARALLCWLARSRAIRCARTVGAWDLRKSRAHVPRAPRRDAGVRASCFLDSRLGCGARGLVQWTDIMARRQARVLAGFTRYDWERVGYMAMFVCLDCYGAHRAERTACLFAVVFCLRAFHSYGGGFMTFPRLVLQFLARPPLRVHPFFSRCPRPRHRRHPLPRRRPRVVVRIRVLTRHGLVQQRGERIRNGPPGAQ